MIWLVGSSVVVLASAFASAALLTKGQLDRSSAWVPGIGILALPVLGFGLAVTTVGGDAGARGNAHPSATSSIAWPGSTSPELPAMPSTTGGERVAPVSSLVDGLKARLEQSPNDANGWALLATSLAFTGDHAGAEAAIARAAALGVDEQALRERVTAAGASQLSSPTAWNDAAAGR